MKGVIAVIVLLSATMRPAGASEHVAWRLVSYANAYPPAHVALQAHVAADWYELYPTLSRTDARDEVWFQAEDRPPADPSPRARSAKLVRWDGRAGDIEHAIHARTKRHGDKRSLDGSGAGRIRAGWRVAHGE